MPPSSERQRSGAADEREYGADCHAATQSASSPALSAFAAASIVQKRGEAKRVVY